MKITLRTEPDAAALDRMLMRARYFDTDGCKVGSPHYYRQRAAQSPEQADVWNEVADMIECDYVGAAEEFV